MTIEEYNIFLKYKEELENKAKWIAKLFDANNMSFSKVDDITYKGNSVIITTISYMFDSEYASADDYKYIRLPLKIFLGSKDDQRKYVQFLIYKENLGLNERHQIKFNDIKD